MLEALGTWFAGVATAGSFWLGFTTLRSDRKREERAQAAKIAIYFERFLKDHQREAGLQLRVRVWNHSEQPIFRTSLHGTEPEGSIRLSVRPMSYDKPSEDPILPGKYAERHLKIPTI